MIYTLTENEIEANLGKKYHIESRRNLDSNPFSNLEIIKFKEMKKEFVLKSIHSILKSEVIVHKLVNNNPLTAAKLLSSDYDDKSSKYYLLMDKIDLNPLFNYQMYDSVHYYKTVAKKLANFHLNFSNVSNSILNKFGIARYEKIIAGLGPRVEKLAEKMNHEYMLSKDLVSEFKSYIGSTKTILEPIKNTKLTLVHGDFDTGNLIINNADNDIYAIDFGLAHIDIPVIDIAHLLSATEMSINTRRDIFEEYYELTAKLFPSSMSLQDVRNAGRIMHMLFFLDWYLFTTETELVPANYFFEQIHNRVKYLTDLLTNSHD